MTNGVENLISGCSNGWYAFLRDFWKILLLLAGMVYAWTEYANHFFIKLINWDKFEPSDKFRSELPLYYIVYNKYLLYTPPSKTKLSKSLKQIQTIQMHLWTFFHSCFSKATE